MFRMLSLVLLFALLGCARPGIDATVQKAQRYMGEGSPKEGCGALASLDPGLLKRWPRHVAYQYLRLKALCAITSGSAPKLTLPAPYSDYYRAMLLVGPGRPLARAKTILKGAFERFPSHPELFYRLGVFHLLDEQFEAALPLLKRALKLGSHGTDRYRLTLARCYLGLGQLEKIPPLMGQLVHAGVTTKSVRQGQRILENMQLFQRLMPAKVSHTVATVRELLKKKNGGKAMDLLREQIQTNPQYGLLRYLLAVVHLRLGNTAGAISQLYKAVQLEPHDSDSWYLLGKLYMGSAHAHRVEGYLKKALALNPLSLKVRGLLRDYYTKRARFLKASDLQESVVWLLGKKTSAIQQKLLGRLQESAGRSKAALATWSRVLKRLGADAGIEAVKALARIHLSLSLSGSGNTIAHRRKAVKYVRMGLKLRPMDNALVAMGKRLGVKVEVAKSPFQKKIRVKGAKEVDKRDPLFR